MGVQNASLREHAFQFEITYVCVVYLLCSSAANVAVNIVNYIK